MEESDHDTPSGKKDPEGARVKIEASNHEGLAQALQSEEVPKIYANGFAVSHGNSDVSLILQQYGKPIAVVQMSFTLAKTLVEKLNGSIQNIEDITGKTIANTDDFESIDND